MKIADYFKKILKRQKEIGYPFPESLNPAANTEQIEAFEQNAGFKMNKDLKELYFIANGSVKNPGSGIDNCLVPLHRFLSLEDAAQHYNNTIRNDAVFDSLFENWTTNTKPGKHLFPFIADDIHCYWVDLNEASDNYGKLYSAINNGESPEYEFNSLPIFFKIILECYKKDIFYLDAEYKFLSRNFLPYCELCKKLNPDIEYWKIMIENC